MDKKKKHFFLAVLYVCFINWLLTSMFSKGTLFGEAKH